MPARRAHFENGCFDNRIETPRRVVHPFVDTAEALRLTDCDPAWSADEAGALTLLQGLATMYFAMPWMQTLLECRTAVHLPLPIDPTLRAQLEHLPLCWANSHTLASAYKSHVDRRMDEILAVV